MSVDQFLQLVLQLQCDQPLQPWQEVLPVMKFWNRNVEARGEIFRGGVDGEALCDTPEVELIASAMAVVTVELVDPDVDGEGPGIVTALQKTVSAETCTAVRCELEVEQSQDVLNRDLFTQRSEVDSRHG